MIKSIGAALFGAALGFAAIPAKADIVETYYFLSDHCTGNCLTGQTNGGSITITDHGGGVIDYLVQLANGNQFINAGFDASFGFNIAGNPTITYTALNPVSGFTLPNGGAAIGSQQNAGSLHMDGTGFFEYGLEAVGSGASDPQGSTLAFTITAPGLDIHDFEGNTPQDQYWAADIISGTTGRTGAIDASNGANGVPEPASLALLGTALFGMGWVARRRKTTR